jgi:hypothetical protein
MSCAQLDQLLLSVPRKATTTAPARQEEGQRGEGR